MFELTSNKLFKIILIDKSIDKNQTNSLSSYIINQSGGNDIDLSISLNGTTYETKIINQAFESPEALNKQIVDFINSSKAKFKNDTLNLVELTNNQIEDIARVLSKIETNTNIIIAGKFPSCYDKENADKIFNKFKKNLKN